jgi:hypothetical protein
MSRKLLKASALLCSLVLTACNQSPTTPSESAVSANKPVLMASTKVDNFNEWQTWGNTWQSNGCTSTLYVSGTVNIHLQQQLKTNADGTIEYSEHFNIAGGTLTDSNGNVSVFQQIGQVHQVSLPSGPYTLAMNVSYKIITKSADPNEFVDFSFTLKWDGTNITFVSSYLLQCHG